jgi:Mg-chelatase subunit ChlD
MRAEAARDNPPRHLSDYWRVDRSTDRSRELASVLGGAAAQAELVQTRLSGAGRLSGVPSPPPVFLDPRLLSGFSAPVPSEVVDCLVGLAVRDGALRVLSVDSSLWTGWNNLDETARAEFALTHRVLEEVYVSARLARLSRTLAAYLRAMRHTLGYGIANVAGCAVSSVPTREAVLHSWLFRRLDGPHGLAESAAGIGADVAALDRLTKPYLMTRDPLRRLALAAEVWQWLSAYPRGSTDSTASWPWNDDRESGWPESDVRRQMRANVHGGGESGRLIDLGQQLQEALPLPAVSDEWRHGMHPEGGDAEMVTAELHEMGVRAAVTAIKDARFDLGDYERVSAEVARDVDAMRHAFSRLDDVRSRWRYGVRRGKIDGRGLTRAAAGKTDVFKSRDRQHGSSLALVFLVDVSASMRSYMPVVNRAACVVAEALRDLAPRVWYEVLTSTSGGLHPGAPVQLTRLAATGKPLSMRDVWTDGGTPTGEAIAAALLILRRRKAARKLILHFTDGHPKDTYVVRQALELCRRLGVDVLTVSVGASQEALYGEGKCEVAYSVSELTSVVARLLPRIYR